MRNVERKNGQILPNPETLVTDLWALRELLEVALDICVVVSWFLLEMVPDSHARVNWDRLSPTPPHI